MLFFHLLGNAEKFRITLLRKGLNLEKSKAFHKSPSVKQEYFAQRTIHMQVFQVTPCLPQN